jgi:NAD(P)-dependent dehydrogenase (short-subunit alcohol dehydrogenase family)
MQLAGKVVLVTGAQQGIGRAMALEFAAAGSGSSSRPPARCDRVQIGVYVTEDVRDTLKQLALNQRTSLQVLLCEAINDLFAKSGLDRLADETVLPRGGAAQAARRRSP